MDARKLAMLPAAVTMAVSVGIAAGAGGAPSPTSPPMDPAAAADWERVVPGGDCACADGSEFNFWVRDADPAKVVLFLEGGGACFDTTSCAFTLPESEYYDWNVSADDDPARHAGILDLANPANPFADHSFVFVPYCTGDVHLGNAVREYSPDLTVEHVGAVNGLAALAYLRDHFDTAEHVVVVGESAGAIASPVYGGLVADLLAEAQITVFGDGAGAYPDNPDTAVAADALWGVYGTMPRWEVNEGLMPQDWTFPRFWVQAGLHDPDFVMARFDHAYDEVQARFIEAAGSDTSDLAAAIAANDRLVAAAGVTRHRYTAPGDAHTLVRLDDFYTMEVAGVRLVDWVSDLVAGVEVTDVACTECGAPPTTA